MLLLCHSNAMREFPAHVTWNGAPLAVVVHVRTAPVAIVITRTPVYGHRPRPQSCSATASLVPSGEMAAKSADSSFGQVRGSFLMVAERPSAASRTRKNQTLRLAPSPISVIT